MDDALNALIEDAYGAALDESRWEAWSERVVERFGGAGGALVVLDARTSQPRLFRHLRGTARGRDEYWAGMIAQDPQMKHSRTLKGNGLYLDTDHVDLSDHATADFIAWERSVVGWRHHMAGYATLGDEHFRVGLSISRSAADGATHPEDQRQFRVLLPHFVRAMQLGFCHAEQLEEAYWTGLTTTRSEATLLLDDDGRILQTNAAMDRILVARLGLGSSDRLLIATSPVDNTRLQQAIKRATAAAMPRSAALAVSSEDRSRFLITVYPLPRRHRTLAPREAAAIVTVVDRFANMPRDTALFRDTLGITARQADLAALLAIGHSIESAANILKIAQPTARLHLHRMLERTGLSRQIDLVRLLARLTHSST